MIEQTKQHISQYSEPALKIQFINETNIDAFRSSEAPVAGTAEIQAGSYVCKGWSGIAVWEPGGRGRQNTGLLCQARIQVRHKSAFLGRHRR
ncbi:MAG: hypothetical protein L6V35_03270 [Alistipes putredinis]|nr:MAG: hypothetical protein L6V35_03270 [Alistipes putredinis]